MIALLKPPRVGRRAFKVWLRNRDTWLKFYRASLVGNLAEPVLFLLAFGLGLSRFISDINGIPYINYIAPGLMLAAAMNAATFECTFGAYTRMAAQKTYDAIIVTPVSIEEVAAGEILWGASKAFLSATIILAVLIPWGLADSPWLVLAPVLFLLSGLMFASLALVVTAFAPSYDYFSYYFSLVVSPMFFFSGVFFPLDHLPPWVQTVSWFLPLTHAVNVSRGLATGHVTSRLLLEGLWMTVFTVAASWLAINLIKKRLIK